MNDTRIKISSILESQLPDFIKEEFPYAEEFLRQYYIANEYSGGPLDLLHNIDKHVSLDVVTNVVSSTILTSDVSTVTDRIYVESTGGFPDRYGLIQIDDEIILYQTKESTYFDGCTRGFSGVSSLESNIPDELVFSETVAASHENQAEVKNLSILFLQEFLIKIKALIAPGFKKRELAEDLNEEIFLSHIKDFYSSKGTEVSFKILFNALYGKNVDLIRPRDFLIEPSDAEFRITKDLVVEAISGNPEKLLNSTIFQDENDFIFRASGAVTQVERILRGDREFYILSLDSDYNRDINVSSGTIAGAFSIHPKTKNISEASAGNTVLDVDSTIGFPESGQLRVDLDNTATIYINYTSKSTTQFFGCSGIVDNIPINSEIKLHSVGGKEIYVYGYGGLEREKIEVRVNGVISNLTIPGNPPVQLSPGDRINIKSLGENLTSKKANNWIFNIPVVYDISSISDPSGTSFIYTVSTFDDHDFKLGNQVTFIATDGSTFTGGYVSSIINQNTVQVTQNGLIPNKDRIKSIKNNLLKAAVNDPVRYPEIIQYNTNVQNVYCSETDKDELYVTSASIPTYLGQNLDLEDRSIEFSGTFNGKDLVFQSEHSFYTGDSVIYRPANEDNSITSEGIYFVRVISPTSIRLAKSRDNIFNADLTGNDGYYVSFSGTINPGYESRIELTDFSFRNLQKQPVESQRLIRKISNPEFDNSEHTTPSGQIGIFINGVEIINYKSRNFVYHGPIDDVAVTAGGTGYDIISPPTLIISDPSGVGATGNLSISGSLSRVDIQNPGFDFIENPVIELTGGAGSGARAIANLIEFSHKVFFNSSSASGVNTTTDVIGFSTYHGFRNYEQVIYNPENQQIVSGLTTNSTYYISFPSGHSGTKICLHKSLSDAASGINTVSLDSLGYGLQSFTSTIKKKKIGSITISDPGSGYKTRKVRCTPADVDVTANILNIQSHGYKSGEKIVYYPSATPIGGLVSGTSYFVTAVNEDQIRLSSVGTGVTAFAFYYNSKQHVDITSSGSGYHEFNYEPITLNVRGRIGVSTESGQDFNAKLIPIFSGEIYGVHLTNNGSNYGSAGILNHNRQPNFSIVSGTNAQITPIISGGKITNVVIANGGKNYNTNPILTVNSKSGSGAKLTPIVQNGVIVGVSIVDTGRDYKINDTSITVATTGQGSKFQAVIKSWTIDLVKRLIEKKNIVDDDGIIDQGLNSEIGLQYCHAYAPRSLRKTVLSESFISGQLTYTPDLTFADNGYEKDSTAHSPIIGWAYDGNPIYGPYGYSDPSTPGSVRRMISSYVVSADSNRPSQYPLGFFVNDYIYDASGDLDEHNGRFCVTPEYPNGTYAYFCTIGNLANSGPFKFFREPQFPYVIGNTYHSKPIEFNFLTASNQNSYDIAKNRLLRNVTPYKLLTEKTSYEFLPGPEVFRSSFGKVEYIGSGDINNVEIIDGGENYSSGDKLVFDNSGTDGNGAAAEIDLINGKNVSQISLASTVTSNIQFIKASPNQPYKFVGFSSTIHNLTNLDEVQIDIEGENTSFDAIRYDENRLFLTSVSVAATISGITTYLNVTGNLEYPNVRENDIYQFGQEQVKVLNIDTLSQRIRVLRNQNGTSGVSSLPVGFALTEKSKKFGINFGITTSYATQLDKEYYFNPSESVGLGTQSGVGINSTLKFTNPGAGITQIKIPTRSIYIPGHNINTGDELIYNSNGGQGIIVSINAGVSTYALSSDTKVYAAKITNDIIGIATVRVGLGTTGSFVGLGLTPSASLLYFTGFGTSTYHSFKKIQPNPLIGSATKRTVTVSTASTHGLNVADRINLTVTSGITTSIVIKYNSRHNRMVANPVDFISSDVNSVTDEIRIHNHGFVTAQKIIFNSISAPGGLIDDTIYYVIVVNNNTIKLANSRYESLNDISVDITSEDLGTISPINPPLTLTKNSVVEFDLSDSSLSYILGLSNLSAFEFNLYTDGEFENKFLSTKSSSTFEVTKTGDIGVDIDAKVTLSINDEVPKILYYLIDPINLSQNTLTDVPVTVDKEVSGNNTINLVNSQYSGSYLIKDTPTTTTFDFQFRKTPEVDSYTVSDVTNTFISYTTNSPTGFGSIASIKINSGGNNYKYLPKISSIDTDFGKNAVLIVNSDSIGTLNKVSFSNIGYDYSSDASLRPTTTLPNVLKVNPAYSFESIGITSSGRNYTIAPNLVVIDTKNDTYLYEVELDYKVGDTNVNIISNTSRLQGEPKIIPVDNINGTKIKTIEFNDLSKDVVVSLASTYSVPSQFPFAIGKKILIENTSVGITTEDRFGNIVVTQTGKGYNSANYNYSLFTITDIDPDYGGLNPSITYNLSNYLSGSDVPGTFNALESYGKVILDEEFPVFNWTLTKGVFSPGETVISGLNVGTVIYWDDVNEYLKVSSVDNFYPGDLLTSRVTGLEVEITEVFTYDSNFDIGASSIVTKGWNSNTGFLNDTLQRIHDSDYYQYFSYSLKSEIEIAKWDDAVSNLNHTAGFKKFSDLQVESSIDDVTSGIQTSQGNGDVIVFADLISDVNVNTVYDFDLATETVLNIDNYLKSDQILFKTKVIQDYIQAVSNRVLLIDDISDEFTNAAGVENYGVADRFSTGRTKKYMMWVGDRSANFDTQRQVQLVTLLQYNTQGYINQYGKVYSDTDLGDFDYRYIDGNNELLFYPIKSEVNDYEMSGVSLVLNDSGATTGYYGLGCVDMRSSSTTISAGAGAGTTNSVVGIASTYRAAKFMIQISNNAQSYFEYSEVSIVHDDTDIIQLEFNNLASSSSPAEVGLGTYMANISPSGLDLWFIPNTTTAVDYEFNIDTIAISGSSTSVGSTIFPGAIVETSHTSIASTTLPTKVAQYTSFYRGAYYIVLVHDTTNNEYQTSEVLVTSDDTDTQVLEFASLATNAGLGTISAGITTVTELTFVPAPGINADVRVIQFALGPSRSTIVDNDVNLGSTSTIDYTNGTFTGTELARKKSFDLYYDGYPLFQKVINPAQDIIASNSSIFLPNHFFSTGEEIVYDPGDTGSPIGIATTSIVGVGTTNKLPTSVYIIKNDNSTFKFAATAADALNFVNLTITDVGVGTEHLLTSIRQNSRCIISLDNVIQSPVVSTAITSSLSSPASSAAEVITLSGISSFFAGDFAQIGNEIITIRAIGYLGVTNDVLVRRGWLGSVASAHTSGSIIRKVYGDYNIIDNTIHFAESPYGNLQLGGTRPDEQDYVGLDVRSSFSGRTFLRSGISEDPYAKNVVFDDLSQKFNGISSQFSLQSNRNDISGISTGNAVVLLNSVFQNPQNIDYALSEVSGITSIRFTGDRTAANSDVNTTSLPRGGVIVSVATTEGFGYQARVSAGATARVSVAGTIQSLSIGNTGGGYRASSEYDIVTSISHPVGIGSTVIHIANTEAVINKLAYSSVNKISVGAALTNITIVSVGNTFIRIGVGSGSSVSIASGTPVHIELKSPTAGLVNISVAQTSIKNAQFVGFTTIVAGRISPNYVITNPGSGYTNTNPPLVIFDDPLPYSDIPLRYSSASPTSGLGTEASIDLVVGSGSSVISFEIKNYGYAYGNGEILTVPIGGLAGIPTDRTKPFREFRLTVESISADRFVGWSIGDLQVLDSIESLFNNIDVNFPLAINNERISIRSRVGSDVREDALLLVFLNNVLQVPGDAYQFDGGSTLRFSIPPRFGDRCSILFYRGTSSVDTIDVEVLDSIKVGDTVTLNDGNIVYQEDPRLVTDIVSTDAVTTNIYNGAGINPDQTYERPLSWTKQTVDLIIDGEEIGKDRELYEANIFPTAKIIKDVSTASTEIFVDNVKTFFDHSKEYPTILQNRQQDVLIHESKYTVGASATCTVSGIGSITSITITNGGVGYESGETPEISFGNISNTRATGTVGVTTSGSIVRATISNSGIGYSYAPIQSLSVISSGTGWPNTGLAYTFSNVRLRNTYSEGHNALCNITIINGSLLSVAISNGGFNYHVDDELYVDVVNYENTDLVLSSTLNLRVSSIDSPPVIFSEPSFNREIMSVSYEGDFGIISGIGTTSYAGVTTGLVFDFVIPKNSFLRDTYVNGTVGIATTGISGIKTGFYFVIHDSNVGNSIISLESDDSPLGIGTTFMNNIFKAAAVSIARTDAVGMGVTWVARVTTKVSNYNDFLTGVGRSTYYGQYSWGRLYDLERVIKSNIAAYRGENLLTYSEFESGWTNTGGVSIGQTEYIAPFSSSYGTKITASASDTGLLRATASLVSGTSYTYSVYVKPISGNEKMYFGSNTGTSVAVSLDFDSPIPSISSKTGSTVNRMLIPQANGWYRASFTFSATASAAHNFIIYSETSNEAVFAVWGAQVESGVDLTQYSKVTHTAVRRNTAVTDENTYPVLRRYNNLRFRGYKS